MAASSGVPLVPDKDTIIQETYLEAIQSNLNSVQKWTNWKDDHEKLKKTLTDLPNKLSHPAVIPFGSRALVKADIVHTNEILTCVGDGWFVKQSARQALELCDRRIKDSEKMLESLEKERNLIKSRLTLPKVEEAFADDDEKDIVEEFDEEKEAAWRVRHREMERKYHQELAELRKKRQEEEPPQTEEDLFRRLDMLELEEELNDELERLGCEIDTDEEDEAETEEEEVEVIEKQDRQEKDFEKFRSSVGKSTLSSDTIHPNSYRTEVINTGAKPRSFEKVERNTSTLEPGQVCYGFTDIEGNEWRKPAATKSEGEEETAKSFFKKRKSVSFASDRGESEGENDEELQPDIFIRFKHSDNDFKEAVKDEHSGGGDTVLINSPRDIYTQFSHLTRSSAPKSALKKTSSYETDSSESGSISQTSLPFGSSFGLHFQDDDDDDENDSSFSAPQRDLSHFPPVLQDVIETPTNVNPSQETVSQPQSVEPTRPVSRFKTSRAASRK